MHRHLQTIAISFIAAIAIAGCSRDAAVDLRERFETLRSGDTIAQARIKLAEPLGTPANNYEAFGLRYSEYRLLDTYSSYKLIFAGVSTVDAVLLFKTATAHSP